MSLNFQVLQPRSLPLLYFEFSYRWLEFAVPSSISIFVSNTICLHCNVFHRKFSLLLSPKFPHFSSLICTALHTTFQNFNVKFTRERTCANDFRTSDLYEFTWFDTAEMVFSGPCDAPTQPKRVEDDGGVAKTVLEATPCIVAAITAPELDATAQRALIKRARKKGQALSPDTTAKAFRLCNFFLAGFL